MPGRSLSKPKDGWKSYKKPPPCVATYSTQVSKIKYRGATANYYMNFLWLYYWVIFVNLNLTAAWMLGRLLFKLKDIWKSLKKHCPASPLSVPMLAKSTKGTFTLQMNDDSYKITASLFTKTNPCYYHWNKICAGVSTVWPNRVLYKVCRIQ